MSWQHALLLLAAGVAGGLTGSIAGLASVATYPALLMVGLPPVAANVTNSLGVSPGYVASVAGSCQDLANLARRRGRRTLLMLLPTSVVGTAAGCALLLVTPGRAFELVVPFLILGATALLAFQHRIRALVGHPRDLTAQQRTVALHALVLLGSAYGGYFGAALGVMLVAALALVLDEPLRYVSALKNAISAVAGLITVVAFATFGPVDWLAVAVLAPATLAGGYAGARVLTRLPAGVLRAIIVAVGTAVGLTLLIRAL